MSFTNIALVYFSPTGGTLLPSKRSSPFFSRGHCHIWPRPWVKRKVFWAFVIRMQSYIRRQFYEQRQDGFRAFGPHQISGIVVP